MESPAIHVPTNDALIIHSFPRDMYLAREEWRKRGAGSCR